MLDGLWKYSTGIYPHTVGIQGNLETLKKVMTSANEQVNNGKELLMIELHGML